MAAQGSLLSPNHELLVQSQRIARHIDAPRERGRGLSISGDIWEVAAFTLEVFSLRWR